MGSESTWSSLQWTTYSTNWRRALATLRTTGQFCDVTIVVDDGYLTAHRMVLTSCSPILARALAACLHPHPAIVLRDINMAQMKGILDFMYIGETKVEQGLLEAFLIAAGELNVTGLIESDNQDDKIETVDDSLVKKMPQKRPLSAPPASFLKSKKRKDDGDKVKKQKLKKKPTKDIQNDVTFEEKSPPKESYQEKCSPSKHQKLNSNGDVEAVKIGNISPKCITPEKIVSKKVFASPKKSNENVFKNEELSVTLTPSKKKVVDKLGYNTNSDQSKKNLVSPKVPTPPTSPDRSSSNKTVMTNLPEDRLKLRDIWDNLISAPEEIDGEIVYSCLKCDKTFKGKSAKSNAWSHVDHNHTPQIEHRCHLCDFISKSNDGVSRHITKTHKKDQTRKEEEQKDEFVYEDDDMIVLD